MTQLLSVAIVTDVRLYRDALEQILAATPQIQVHSCDAGWAACIDSLQVIEPRIVLADAALVCNGDFVTRVRKRLPATGIIAFGVSETHEDITACARAGAQAIVLRSASSEELIDVVLGFERGEMPVSPRAAALLYNALVQRPAGGARTTTALLTNREAQVLALMQEGCSNKEIARRLFIGLPTAKNHVHNILEKLGVPRRSAAIAAVMRQQNTGVG